MNRIDSELIQLSKESKTLPYGSFAMIASKHKVSREWVRVRAKQLNIKVKKYSLEKRKCDYCQKMFRPRAKTTMFCSVKCVGKYRHYSRKKLLICSNCNKGFLRIAGDINTCKRRHTVRNSYCSRKCFFKGIRSDESRKWMSKVKKTTKL